MRAWEAMLLAAALMIPAVPAGAETTSTTTFEWSTREHLGDTVARIDLTLSEATDCTIFMSGGGSQAERGGPIMLFYIENETDTLSSSVVSVYRNPSVHVTDTVDNRRSIRVADTVTLFPTGTWGADVTVQGPLEAGSLSITFGGVDLHSITEDSTRPGYHAMAFDINCQAPFTVDGYAAGHEWLGFRSNTMEDGAGASVGFVAEAQVDEHVEHGFTSPEVVSHVSWREYQDGAHTGELVRTTPDGTRTIDLDVEPTGRIDDVTGPGLHSYDLTRIGLEFFSAVSGVAYGLGPVDSLDAVVPSA